MMSAADAETAVVTYSNIRFAFHVSLPGHSCAADEAPVYVVPDCGTLCAFGMAMHVVKVDGVWLPAPVEGVWMS